MKTEYKSSQHIKRWLTQNMGVKSCRAFHIHHIDHNPSNNQLENLIRLTAREHKIAHLREAPVTPSGFKYWLIELRKTTPEWDR